MVHRNTGALDGAAARDEGSDTISGRTPHGVPDEVAQELGTERPARID